MWNLGTITWCPVVLLALLTSTAVGCEEADAAPTTMTPIVYAAIGDSTGVGVGARGDGYVGRLHQRLRAQRPGSTLVNLSESGATTDRALRVQVPRLRAGAPPGLVTIGIGANDVTRGITPAEFAERFEAIVAGVRARTAAPIVVSNLPDLSLAPAVPAFARDEAARRIQALNAAIARVVARHELVLFDAYTMSRNYVPKHPEFFSPDGFHPSDAGYEFWAARMWDLVRGVLGASG